MDYVSLVEDLLDIAAADKALESLDDRDWISLDQVVEELGLDLDV